MFGHLNVQTKRVVRKLCEGETITLGGETVDALSRESRKLLALLSENTNDLQELPGGPLVDKVLELQKEFKLELSSESNGSDTTERIDVDKKRFRIGLLRAYSFRGLAPAEQIWSFDFAGQSHLLYGPNGCGKSSLLGAICWCLTGKLFRDDGEPCETIKVKSYPADDTNVGQIERDDAQSLMDADGNSSSPSELYWVSIQLLCNIREDYYEEVWLKRESDGSLSRSDDGNEWSEISGVGEIGINEIDVELHLLMPAKVSHLRFGKNPDLVHLLAEIVGYGNLETIGEIAESLGRNARTIRTNTQRRELEPEERKVEEHIGAIKDLANEAVKDLPTYKRLCGDARTREDIEAFGKTIGERVKACKAKLASDLGITEPEENTEEYQQYLEKRNILPGQASSLLSELEKPLTQIFPKNIGLEIASEKEINVLEKKLTAFEQKADIEIEERLVWAEKSLRDEKADLMLKASEYFPGGSNNCPVCTQTLDCVADIKRKLEQLRPLSSKAHLHKKIEDHERSLVSQLSETISPKQQTEGETDFAKRLLDDWADLKNSQCKDLLLPIAERFDDGIAQIANEIQQGDVERFTIPSEYEEQFAGSFSDYGERLFKAKQYVELCKAVLANKETVSEKLHYLLKERKLESNTDVLKEILERGRATNEELKALIDIHAKTRELWKSAKKLEELREKIEALTEIANNADPIKELKQSVRKEVTNLVSGCVGEQAKRYYELLYDKEVLEFEKLTTGHATNPDIKDQINLYLRAGQHQVPMERYSNAGRMRALCLSFVFALLKQNHGSIGLLILDDPALSLDDEHKARFVDNLVGPTMSNEQVVLGTHYERFFEDCGPVFQEGTQLKMVPRRRTCDQVEFEAGNLLARVQQALDENRGNWREVGGNLRIWIEKTLVTISGYCPQPFVVYNNLRLTLDNYAGITNSDVATTERNTIVQAFRCTHVQRVIDKLHHNEPINKPDVEDALRILQQQGKKAVEKEITRFKGLYQHALLGRRQRLRVEPILTILPFTHTVPDTNLDVVRQAAAAHNSEGIEWDENDRYLLEGYSVVVLKSDVISPIAESGQYLVLDWQENDPENKDLVVVETDDDKRYVRRIWRKEDGTILLEAANTTRPYEPVQLLGNNFRTRRIVGVLFDMVNIAQGYEGDEWVTTKLPDSWFERIVGVRVHGTSLEPVARNKQIVLVEKTEIGQDIPNDMLACVSIRDKGDFIKRCYVNEPRCVLCSVNPTEREIPIFADTETILQVYPLKGVLFEVGVGSTNE